MQSKLLSNNNGERFFMLIVDVGEEAFNTIRNFAVSHNIAAASVSAIGAFETATLAFFNLASKSYSHIPVGSQTEVLSLVGHITLDDEENPSPHLHAVLGLADGHTRGGHFIEGTVRPTLEVIIREMPAELGRSFRTEFGIALIDTST